jgi:hypothetical protein
MAAVLSVCTKEEQHSMIGVRGQKVYQVLQSIKDFQHNMGTVFCCNRMSANGLRN